MIRELSIIIPALNEENYLPLLLQSIAEQNFHGKLQVIVVDGQSEDNTVRVAKRFQNKIPDLEIITVKRGIGYQRNKGAEKAKYEYLLFLDADMLLPKALLNALSKKVKDANSIATVALLPTGKNILDYVVILMMYPAFLFVMYFQEISTPGGFTLTTKEIHQKINGFPEGLIMGEDIEYGRRAIAAGATFHMFLSLHAFHSPRRARELGRFGLLWYWWKSHKYVQEYGPLKEGGSIKYPYGHYEKPLKERKTLY